VVGDIEAAVFLDCAIDQRLDIVLAGYVGTLKNRASLGGGDFRDHQFSTLRVEIANHNCRTFFCEPDCGGFAHSACRAGYDCNFSIELAHRRSPSRSQLNPLHSKEWCDAGNALLDAIIDTFDAEADSK